MITMLIDMIITIAIMIIAVVIFARSCMIQRIWKCCHACAIR